MANVDKNIRILNKLYQVNVMNNSKMTTKYFHTIEEAVEFRNKIINDKKENYMGGYPLNIINLLIQGRDDNFDMEYITSHFEENFKYLISNNPSSFSERDLDLINLRFKERQTLVEIGRKYNLTRERVRQIECNIINKLKKNYYLKYFTIGKELLEKEQNVREKFLEDLKNFENNQEKFDLSFFDLTDLDLDTRTFNTLKRAKFNKIIDLINFIDGDYENLYKISGFGSTSIKKLKVALEKFKKNNNFSE